MLAAMPAAEFDLWREFYQSHGFDADRIEGTVANVGAAWSGGSPSQYVAKFGEVSRRLDHVGEDVQRELLVAALDGIGAKGGDDGR
jgi:hypothetical protein